MTTYTVLYHDPLSLSADERTQFEAGHSVWVCRDDRYAFEVCVVAERGSCSMESCGEARYRLAMASLAARHAQQTARRNPQQVGSFFVRVTATQIADRLDEGLAVERVNFGDVIHRFVVESLVSL